MAGQHMFASKAQWRWAHARFGHGDWVKRWTHRNQAARPFRTLPRRKTGRKRGT